MEARRAIQQNMYRENSWGDGKQRLEELTTFPFSFRRKRLRWSGESSLEQRKLEPFKRMTSFFERIDRAVRTVADNFFSNGYLALRYSLTICFERKAGAVRTDTKSLK